MTNLERIRNISEDELAKIILERFDIDGLCGYCSKSGVGDCRASCEEAVIKWLRSESK